MSLVSLRMTACDIRQRQSAYVKHLHCSAQGSGWIPADQKTMIQAVENVETHLHQASLDTSHGSSSVAWLKL